MAHTLRILDANANRAREALRVMEEAARFLLDDAALTEQVKAARHDLAQLLQRMPPLPPHRDTPGDVGTAITTPTEMVRDSAAEVVIASAKRLSESLRALEEYGKTIDPTFSSGVERLRYVGYDLERRLFLAMPTGRAPQWRLCVLISESLCPGGDWLTVSRAALAGGADCLQLREKQLDGGDLLGRADRLKTLCREAGASLIVNDRPDIALLAGADGVHLGQADLPIERVRCLVGRRLIVGLSTANPEQAEAAVRAGADYCGLGPMFPSLTKPKPTLSGPAYLRAFVERYPHVPHLAISGITPQNLAELVAAGCQGVAVSSAVCSARDPEQATRRLRAALESALADRAGAS